MTEPERSWGDVTVGEAAAGCARYIPSVIIVIVALTIFVNGVFK